MYTLLLPILFNLLLKIFDCDHYSCLEPELCFPKTKILVYEFKVVVIRTVLELRKKYGQCKENAKED